MRLALIHNTEGLPAPERSLTWKTCRREVHFLEEPIALLPDGALADADAYRLLLELVCGLHSPIIGETEVQAQFKTFAAAAAEAGRDALSRFCQRLLSDAKKVRHSFLQGFGAHSYGSLALQHFTGSRLVVVGTGALAAEIVGTTGNTLPIDVWGRRLPDAPILSDDRIRHRILADGTSAISHEPCTLIIAAPVGASDLAKVLTSYVRVARVVDLRAAAERTPWAPDTPLVTLDDLFIAAPKVEGTSLDRIAAARLDIGHRSTAFMNQADLRPFGWDDLCA